MLKYNVHARPRDINGQLPISIAINFHNREIKKLLESYNPTVRTKRNDWFHGKITRKEAEDMLEKYADKVYGDYMKLNLGGSDILKVLKINLLLIKTKSLYSRIISVETKCHKWNISGANIREKKSRKFKGV